MAASAPAASAAPTVTIETPLNGTVTNESTPTFNGKGEAGYVVTLQVYDGPLAEGTPVQTRPTFLLADGKWSLGLLKTLVDGVYTARASQTNNQLETGISAPVTFTITHAGPVVTLEQPRPSPGEAAPSFAGTAADTTPVTVEIEAGGSDEGTIVSLASAAGTGAGWHSSSASPALPVGRYTAVAVQHSSLRGNPDGRSAPMSFDVLPPAPPPPSQPLHSGVAALAQASRAPKLMAPFPVVRIAGVALAGGLKLRLLKVQQAPAGALVRVRCRGRGCPPATVRRMTVTGPHGVRAMVFGSFERYLRPGAMLQVFISKPGEIGKYTRLRVRRGKLPDRLDLCLDPSGVKPIACPAA